MPEHRVLMEYRNRSKRATGGAATIGRHSTTPPLHHASSRPIRPANWRQLVGSPIRITAVVIIVLLAGGAVFAPVISPYDPLDIDMKNRLAGPSSRHLLGTDELGRDLFSNILYASRISLLVGAGATADDHGGL